MAPILVFLGWSARSGGLLLGVGIFVGLLVPPLAAVFRDVVTVTVATLMTLVLLRVDPVQVLGYLRRPMLVVALCGFLLLVSPVIAFGVAWATGLDGPLGAALVIMAAGCAATSSPAFARMVGLDGEVSLVVAVITTLLVPFTAPPIALGLLGIDLSISVAALMGRLCLVVLLPLAVSIVIRRIAGQERLRAFGPAVDGAVVWMVVLYGFGVMDGMLALLLADPAWVIGGVTLAFAGNFGLNILTAAVFAGQGRRLALSAGLLSGNRNMALFLAVLPTTTDARILLFFALCQFPLFLSPAMLRPLYRRIGTS
ncbi:bile acid:sodium symporter family protein [Humitalea sp. 24SJ18S-53]|uniref:bile acid:sodium symporter family protein n=1 Tax=Humitalea sp. 24SJ18S-53 TaxID=3422307 RepID=UPI003D66B01B